MKSVLRLATPDDAESILEIYSPSVLDSAVSFELSPPTVEDMAERIEQILTRAPWLILEDASGPLGYAYASPHRSREAYQWSVEVSVYVSARSRRQGVGRTLYSSLFNVLAAQGFANVLAGITLPNEASVGLHESMGFSPVGIYRRVGYKFGQWHDVGWWQRSIRDPLEAPAPPTLLADFGSTEAFLQTSPETTVW